MTDPRKSRDKRTFRFEPRHLDFHKKAHTSFKHQQKTKSKDWFEEK